MVKVAFREAVYARLAQYLADAFPDLPAGSVVRNPGNALQTNAIMPALNCFDGGQAPVDGQGTPPEIVLRMEWDVEGWVTAEQHADLMPALNDLHARVVEAMTPGDEIPLVTADGSVIGLWVEEGQMAPSAQTGLGSQDPVASFLQEFRIEVTRNRGEAFVELPDPD